MIIKNYLIRKSVRENYISIFSLVQFILSTQ